jgi:hypothetical protein
MKVVGKFRRDDQGGFQPELSATGGCDLQYQKAARLGRLLQDTRRDADILKHSSNGSSTGEAIVVSDTIFANSGNPTEEVCKATSMSYDPNSGEVQSYSARIVGPGERIKLRYSASPLLLELNASNFSGNSGTVTRRLQLKEVEDNLFVLSEGTVRR